MPRFAAARAALLPALADRDTAELQRALDAGGPQLNALINRQQLAPLWHARTKAEVFAGQRLKAAMTYLRQRAAQQEIDDLFARKGINYAVFKGAAIRELIYDDPALRLCCDIDILVAPDQRAAAASALVDAGYRLAVEPSNVSHEVSLTKDLVAIDLHWDLLRPGRTPAPMTARMLARRQRHAGRWVLSDADAFFVILVHPAISKHLSTTLMGLHRVADVVLWLQRRNPDWAVLHDDLAACGLKTAAWTMLSLVRMLSPATFDPGVENAIRTLRPGRVRAAYLNAWLNRDFSAALANLHTARLLGMSLWLHDKPSDAWRAVRGWQQSRRTRETDSLVFGELGEPACR
jgi:hypothetical protein